MSKIYSRKRFILRPYSKSSKNKKQKKRIVKIIIIITIILIVLKMLLSYIDPIFRAMCEDKLKSIATIITNQQSTIIMNKYQYDELYTIEKDDTGNVLVIKSNVVPINNLISDLTENVQNEFNKVQQSTIDVPIGNLSGSYFLSGSGPSIPIKVSMLGTLDTEIKSEFIDKGINQTLHRIYVNFNCSMRIVTPMNSYTTNIVNQVIIAEHIIVGRIPDTYYNLEGMDSPGDTLNVID